MVKPKPIPSIITGPARHHRPSQHMSKSRRDACRSIRLRSLRRYRPHRLRPTSMPEPPLQLPPNSQTSVRECDVWLVRGFQHLMEKSSCTSITTILTRRSTSRLCMTRYSSLARSALKRPPAGSKSLAGHSMPNGGREKQIWNGWYEVPMSEDYNLVMKIERALHKPQPRRHRYPRTSSWTTKQTISLHLSASTRSAILARQLDRCGAIVGNS